MVELGGERFALHPIPTADLDESPRWRGDLCQAFLEGAAPAPTGETLHDELINTFLRYVEFRSDGALTTVAIYTLGSYLYCVFESYPYLHAHGPKGSGKTRLLEVEERLAFSPVMTASISTALLFRRIAATGCVLLVDEAESLRRRGSENDDLLLVLNSGYRRGGAAHRLEREDEKFVPRRYPTYSPKIIANISGLGNLLADRCIRIGLLRASSKSGVSRQIVREGPEWAALRANMYAWSLTHWREVRDVYHELVGTSPFAGRTGELWIPLLSVAAVLEGGGAKGVSDTLTGYAESTISSGQGELGAFDSTLLQALLKVTADSDKVGYAKELIPVMRELDRDGELDLDRVGTARSIGHALNRFQIPKAGSGHARAGTPRNVKRDHVLRLAETYGVSLPAEQTSQRHTGIEDVKHSGLGL